MSGLSYKEKILARDVVCDAAVASFHARAQIRYSEGAHRWDAINQGLKYFKGEFPKLIDCSAFDAWLKKQGLNHVGQTADTLNYLDWKAGSTYSMLAHGPFVAGGVKHWLRGDSLIYKGHTANYMGGGIVCSQGNDAGPLLLDWDYRKDLVAVRRSII